MRRRLDTTSRFCDTWACTYLTARTNLHMPKNASVEELRAWWLTYTKTAEALRRFDLLVHCLRFPTGS